MSATILCVDDEAALREDIVTELRAEGYEVHEAANGREALDVFPGLAPDLVLCDVQMPGLSGHDVLIRLRGMDGPGRSVPFVFLTAHGQRHDQLLGRRLGADDYLLKPIDFDLMLATVASRLRNAQSIRDESEAHIKALEDRLRRRSATVSAPVGGADGAADGPAASADAAMLAFVASELPLALARGDLRLLLQPKIRLSDGDVVGAEALLRWTHPDHGAIPPAAFVPAAERAGLAPALGAWVTEQAVRTVARLQSRGLFLRVSFNVSVRDLDPGLADHLRHLLRQTGVPPWLLEVEITETSAVSDLAVAVQAAKAVRALGVAIAVDDFGTGFASLSYLRHFPLDTLKIDQSFVSRLSDGSVDQCIVQSVMALAGSMGLGVIAEGVETADQAALLTAMGCTTVQGFLYSPALPIEAFEEFVLRRLCA
jgi:EAL domain-containing protein (putative c-di-GMP-specific phosphodiesterase class I)/CheY-like chemotaxis protein